ncbi:hypothetical protein ACFOEY_16365 [Paracandidimonas soli]
MSLTACAATAAPMGGRLKLAAGISCVSPVSPAMEKSIPESE